MTIKLIKEKSKTNVAFGYKITNGVISVDVSDSICKVANVLRKHNIGVVVVKSGGRLAGILSERDIVHRVVSKGRPIVSTKAGDVMTKKVIMVNLDEGLNRVYSIIKEVKFRHLPVVRQGEVVGMVSNRDLIYLRRLKVKLEK